MDGGGLTGLFLPRFQDRLMVHRSKSQHCSNRTVAMYILFTVPTNATASVVLMV